MSNKPPKHSELKREGKTSAQRMLRDWGQGRSTKPNIPIRPERILIVSEGTKTEPLYFGAFKRIINARFRGEYISVEVFGMGENTISLLESARRIAENDADGFTQVWVVFDRDSFSAERFNAVEQMCDASGGSGTVFRAAWSNEAFELWFILHFAYVESALSRSSYMSTLSRYMEAAGYGRYRKNREDMYEVLYGRVGFAVENAKRLESLNEDKTPAESNPGTTVHKLVSGLLPYVGKDNV